MPTPTNPNPDPARPWKSRINRIDVFTTETEKEKGKKPFVWSGSREPSGLPDAYEDQLNPEDLTE